MTSRSSPRNWRDWRPPGANWDAEFWHASDAERPYAPCNAVEQAPAPPVQERTFREVETAVAAEMGKHPALAKFVVKAGVAHVSVGPPTYASGPTYMGCEPWPEGGHTSGEMSRVRRVTPRGAAAIRELAICAATMVAQALCNFPMAKRGEPLGIRPEFRATFGGPVGYVVSTPTLENPRYRVQIGLGRDKLSYDVHNSVPFIPWSIYVEDCACKLCGDTQLAAAVGPRPCKCTPGMPVDFSDPDDTYALRRARARGSKP